QETNDWLTDCSHAESLQRCIGIIMKYWRRSPVAPVNTKMLLASTPSSQPLSLEPPG
ncbi:hypothetical protein BgiBS90_009246, partial [Biomphalaria glabrata]